MTDILISILGIFLFLNLSAAESATLWPAGESREIGHMGMEKGLPAGYEPSGAVWHPGRQKLLIVDDSGIITEMDPFKGRMTSWNVRKDLEGIALKEHHGHLVYLALEHPDSILEFDLNTGTLTGKKWDLTPWLKGPKKHGLEALTYGNGRFYAGLQEDGKIFTFKLLEDGKVEYLSSFSSHKSRDDISGLHFDSCTGILYAVHDKHNMIVEMNADGSFIREYNLPGKAQEGITIIGGESSSTTTIFIAQDSGEVMLYEQYPVPPCRKNSFTE